MKRWSSLLIALGAVLTAFGVTPVRLIEGKGLAAITSSYLLMMALPAVIAIAILFYQRSRGVDLASTGLVLVIGVVMGTIPFWGPDYDPGMKMKLDWIGTIVGHYLAGASVVLGGLLQLGAPRSRRSGLLPG